MSQTNNTSFLGNLPMPVDDPNAKTMIEVDHVSMVFNIASEQLNSLKEYAIALSRRELRFKEFFALDDVSFDVKQGDVFGILGTNGSGKSTVLKIIAGVLEPSRGTCTVHGNIAPLIELGAGFDLELTARENIFLNGALLGYSKKFIRQHFEEIVDFAEVRDFLDMPMKNYSSGMVARIAFAIATVIVPDILIVDEVLSVGDFMFQQKCERRIQDLIKEHGVTVLIVSHDNHQIERLCNKAVWIEKGHLRAIGSAKDVCSIYRAVGGRAGSAESESAILKVLAKIKTDSTPISVSIAGENRYGTVAQLATYTESHPSTIFIVNSDSRDTSFMANGLAGLVDGITLTTAQDSLSGPTSQELRHFKPARIVIVGTEGEVGAGVESDLHACCPDAAIVRIESGESSPGLDAYRYGLEAADVRDRWGERIAIATGPCNAPLMALNPYLFESAVPVFFVDEGNPDLDAIANPISRASECIVVASEHAIPDENLKRLNSDLSLMRFPPLGDVMPENRMVNEWIRSMRGPEDKSRTVVVTSPFYPLDNYCLGQFAGRLHAEILFADPFNLDSIALSLEMLRENPHAEKLIFIGNDLRFSKIDKLMFEAVLAADASSENEAD